jgi:hypothetical protein
MATWSVNSYSYPNPFQSTARAQHAWAMFKSFVDHAGYGSVKTYWDNNSTRRVRPHAVESWKAAFEEFGLVYVLAGSDSVTITPGGHQLVAATDANNDREFAWVALNLVLRYPARGEPGRGAHGVEFDQADLLLYWFLHAALVELDGFWHHELFRVLAHIFRRAEAQPAVDLVRQLRSGPADINHHPDPSGGQSGGVYNSLNQVLVHGSLNHMLFTRSKEDSQYFPGTKENWWHLRDEFRDLIELALGGQGPPLPAGCATQTSLMQRMPGAPSHADELAYFDYIGAAVTPLAEAQAHAAANAAPVADVEGVTVFLLSEGVHFTRLDANRILGPVHALCVLAEERRVIVSDRLERTYMVEHKELTGSEVVIRLRGARPIIDCDYVSSLFGGATDV